MILKAQRLMKPCIIMCAHIFVDWICSQLPVTSLFPWGCSETYLLALWRTSRFGLGAGFKDPLHGWWWLHQEFFSGKTVSLSGSHTRDAECPVVLLTMLGRRTHINESLIGVSDHAYRCASFSMWLTAPARSVQYNFWGHARSGFGSLAIGYF